MNEIRPFFGSLYLAGVIQGYHRRVHEIRWYRFRNISGNNGFMFLLTCLRFDNANKRKERQKLDKLVPIRIVVEEFLDNCPSAYTLCEYFR